MALSIGFPKLVCVVRGSCCVVGLEKALTYSGLSGGLRGWGVLICLMGSFSCFIVGRKW